MAFIFARLFNVFFFGIIEPVERTFYKSAKKIFSFNKLTSHFVVFVKEFLSAYVDPLKIFIISVFFPGVSTAEFVNFLRRFIKMMM